MFHSSRGSVEYLCTLLSPRDSAPCILYVLATLLSGAISYSSSVWLQTLELYLYGQSAFYHLPIDNLPKLAYVFGTPFLVVEVIGVLPHVDAVERCHPVL